MKYIKPAIKIRDLRADDLMQIEISNAYSEEPALVRYWYWDEESGDNYVTVHDVWDD